MRRLSYGIVLVALTAAIAVPQSAVVGSSSSGKIVDEGWMVKFPEAKPGNFGHQGVRLRDELEFNEVVSVLRAIPGFPQDNRWKSCSAIDSEPCASSTKVDFTSVLQPCAASTQLDCLVDFGTVDADGRKVPATYSGPFPAVGLNDFPANASMGLPVGGPGALWSVSDSAGVPVRMHLVRAVVAGSKTREGKVAFENFAANVTPVAIRKIACGASEFEKRTKCQSGDSIDPDLPGGKAGYSGYSEGSLFGGDLDCVATGNLDAGENLAECAERKALNKDVRYYLTVRLSQAVSGWMHGRLADPSVTLESIVDAPGAVTLSVSAKPVSVPSIVLFKKFADLPPSLQEKYRATGGWPTKSGGYGGASGAEIDAADPLQRNRLSLPSPFGADAIAELEAWIPVVNDTAIADVSTWTLRTLGSNNLGAASGCITDKSKVAGIVTTNATVYKAGAPEYDAATKSLVYTVSAPHHMSSGETFKGSYGLIIRSDIARCIYKFTSAPIKATIEVIDTGAETNTVATNVSEADGWMKLSATGFTHSTPTIRSTFTQDQAPEVSSVATVGNSQSTGGSSSGNNVPVGGSTLQSSLLKLAKISASGRSKVTLGVAPASKKVCRVSGKSIRAIAKGTCLVTITVSTGAKRTKKSVKLTVA